MFRLTKAEIRKVKRGGRVEIFRRKGGGQLVKLYQLSRGEPIDALVCSGLQNREIYRARLIVRSGKKIQCGEYVYGFYITVLEVGERPDGRDVNPRPSEGGAVTQGDRTDGT